MRTWSTTDLPVLPGFYLNFAAAAAAAIGTGIRGTVITTVAAHWGPIREPVEITQEAGITENFTDSILSGATAYNAIRMALLGGAQKVLAYRLASSAAAKATRTLKDTTAVTPVDVMTVDAKYEGTRGNDFKITVQVNPLDALKKDIILYEGTVLLETFTFTSGTVQAAVDAVNDADSAYVTATKLATGNGTLADITTQSMASGDSGITGIAAQDYTDALAAFETLDFNLLSVDTADDGIQTSVVAWVQSVREDGKGIIAVLGGTAADDIDADAVSLACARAASYDTEGVVCVGNGATLDDVDYASFEIAPYIAGLIAGQKLSESITYAPTPFDDVTRRWTRSEQELGVADGVLLLITDGTLVKVLKGINSLSTLGQSQNASWKKIRTIRVMDAITSDLVAAAEANYVGKINNTEEGRATLIAACKQYMETLVAGGVIESGYTVELDPTYYGTGHTIDPAADAVYIKFTATVTDVVEQILGTFVVA